MSTMTARVLPWSIGGFCLMVVTGLLLFYANPVDLAHNVWFRLKVILLVVAADERVGVPPTGLARPGALG